jgi:hypothetical protein
VGFGHNKILHFTRLLLQIAFPKHFKLNTVQGLGVCFLFIDDTTGLHVRAVSLCMLSSMYSLHIICVSCCCDYIVMVFCA